MVTQLQNEIFVANAPAIPGLRFRGFQGESDYPNILACIQACIEVDKLERADTLEDVANHFNHLNNCDLDRDMLIAEIDGEVVGYCRVEWRQEQPSLDRMYPSLGYLKPAWRRRGLGAAMLQYGEERLRQVASAHPLDGRRFFEAFINDTETGRKAMFLQAGYKPERHFYEMVRPDLENIPEAPLPAGIEVRPAQPEHYRSIWEEMAEAFRDHWSYTPPTEDDFQHFLASSEFQPDLWQIGWDGDQVVGTVLGWINHQSNAAFNRKRGWTEEITVRRPYRGRGIARALIACCLRALKERGMTSACLGVDTQNLSGALHLYESMGYRPVRSSAIYRKPMDE